MKIKNIVIRPIITEKALRERESGKYFFQVNKLARRNQIKQTIENLFEVKVKKVWTIITEGKSKRVGRLKQFKKEGSWKKVIVKLKPGQKIEILEEKSGKGK